MKRFRNILVVHDDGIGADDALSQASALARANEAKLTIASVAPSGRQAALVKTETAKRLNRLADGLRLEGVGSVDCAVLEGVAFAAIIAQVAQGRHDIVIIGEGPDLALRSMLFAGTAANLVRKCPCPVWVLKPGQSVPYAKILAAVDPLAGLGENSLDRKIMDLATSLARRDAAALHIVHAWDVDGKDADSVRSEIRPDDRRRILERHEERHRAAVDALLSRYPMAQIDYRVHLPRDLGERAIGHMVEREGIDLIVMGTVARAGIAGLLIGNAVERILDSVDCGVLAVKPDSFRVPAQVTRSQGWSERHEDPHAMTSRHVA